MAKKRQSDPPVAGPRIKSKLKKIVRLLDKAAIPYVDLLLFGSRARGLARPQSDIDICIVLPNKTPDCFDVRLKAQLILTRNDLDVDVITATEKEYKKNRISPILHEIRTSGVRIQEIIK